MAPPTYTADQLLRLNLPDKRTELVRGALVVREPAGYQHGLVAARMARILLDHAEPRHLGLVFGAETGFKLDGNPATVRAPDAAFIRAERVPAAPPRGFADLAPDLVVEVLSPEDRPGEVLAKVADWLRAGCRLVWVVDPVRRLAQVYRHDGTQAGVTDREALDGEDVLPGLVCPLATVL